MNDQIDEILSLSRAHPSPQAQERSLAALRKSISADAVLLVAIDKDIAILAAASPSLEVSSNLIRTAAPALIGAPRTESFVKKFTFRDQTVQMLAVPCGSDANWLIVWIRAEGSQLASALQIARLAAPSIPLQQTAHPSTAQAALSLLSAFSEPRKSRLAKFASEASKLLGSDRLFVARHSLWGWRVVASSPPPIPASRSALHESLGQAFSLVPSTSGPLLFPAPEAHPALAEICRLTETSASAAIPAGESWALLATWRSSEPLSSSSIETALSPLFPLLPAIHHPTRSHLQTWRALPTRKRGFWLLAAAAIAVIMLLPLHLRVHSQVILEPSLRRFIAAPFDSVLKKVHVEAGAAVFSGTLLAELDGKEVRERIAEIEAQAASANLQSAADLAGSRFDDSALSSLQAQRAGHELEVLRQREKDLLILSPINGIVIQGDLEREEGAALKLGRSIMEIAPLDAMVAEVALREEDAAFVHQGQKVTVRLHALPSADIRATIKKINPRAETRDGRNIFIAEAEIPNPKGEFRPGMKGDAVVIADRLPLFWILFRKPWNTLRSWLFW